MCQAPPGAPAFNHDDDVRLGVEAGSRLTRSSFVACRGKKGSSAFVRDLKRDRRTRNPPGWEGETDSVEVRTMIVNRMMTFGGVRLVVEITLDELRTGILQNLFFRLDVSELQP